MISRYLKDKLENTHLPLCPFICVYATMSDLENLKLQGQQPVLGEMKRVLFFLRLACGLILLDLLHSECTPFKFPPRAELLCNSQQHQTKSVIKF